MLCHCLFVRSSLSDVHSVAKLYNVHSLKINLYRQQMLSAWSKTPTRRKLLTRVPHAGAKGVRAKKDRLCMTMFHLFASIACRQPFSVAQMYPQDSSPLSKLESSQACFRRAYFRCYSLCLLERKCSTQLKQIHVCLTCKCCFQIVCMLPSNIPVLPVISFTKNRASVSTTAFTAAIFMFNRRLVSFLTDHFIFLKASIHLNIVRMEMDLGSYISYSSQNICFAFIPSAVGYILDFLLMVQCIMYTGQHIKLHIHGIDILKATCMK